MAPRGRRSVGGACGGPGGGAAVWVGAMEPEWTRAGPRGWPGFIFGWALLTDLPVSFVCLITAPVCLLSPGVWDVDRPQAFNATLAKEPEHYDLFKVGLTK